VAKLPDVAGRYEIVEGRGIDPAMIREFVIWRYRSGWDVGDKDKVHVHSFTPGEVFFVAEESGWNSVRGAGDCEKTAGKAGFFAEFAGGGLQGGFSGFEFAAHRKPSVKPAMVNDQDSMVTSSVDGDGKSTALFTHGCFLPLPGGSMQAHRLRVCSGGTCLSGVSAGPGVTALASLWAQS